MGLTESKQLWDKTIKDLAISDKVDFEKDIYSLYCEEQRYYHNLYHIGKLVEEYESLETKNEHLVLAIWFHDIVYDPKATGGKNEMESAEYMKKFQENSMVDAIIRATIKHQLPQEMESKDDCAIFLDMDLSVLGWKPEQYNDYCHRIRMEYHHVPNDKFIPGRIKVLEHLGSQETIYLTDHFRLKYESQARENMKNEIQFL